MYFLKQPYKIGSRIIHFTFEEIKGKGGEVLAQFQKAIP